MLAIVVKFFVLSECFCLCAILFLYGPRAWNKWWWWWWLERRRPLNGRQGLCIRLYGYGPKSATSGLGCGLGCSRAPSMTITQQTQHIRQLWRYKSNHIKSFISGNTAHRKTKRDRNRQKHRNTLRITSRQKDRQTKANYIYKLQANYINYTNT